MDHARRRAGALDLWRTTMCLTSSALTSTPTTHAATFTTRFVRPAVVAAIACVLLCGLASAAPSDSFGDGIAPTVADGTTVVRIGELMVDPSAYVDKRVRVEGLVDDVCPMKGCWIDILEAEAPADRAKTVRFKVEDDVIVFPAEAKGRAVVAEGILRAREMDEESARAWFHHLAEEKGEEFDPTSVTGPMTIYQIEGQGAVLRD